MENFAPSLCFKGIKIHYVVFRLPVVLVGTHWDNHQLSFFFGLRILLHHIHISSCLPAPPLAHCLMRKPKCNFRTRRLYQRGLSLLQGQNMSHFPLWTFSTLPEPLQSIPILSSKFTLANYKKLLPWEHDWWKKKQVPVQTRLLSPM